MLVAVVVALPSMAATATNFFDFFGTVHAVAGGVSITFPQCGLRWLVIAGSRTNSYVSQYGQTLSLTNDQKITLADRHVCHEIHAIATTERSGLIVKTTEDWRSMGGSVTQSAYFVQAKRDHTQGQPTAEVSGPPGAQR